MDAACSTSWHLRRECKTRADSRVLHSRRKCQDVEQAASIEWYSENLARFDDCSHRRSLGLNHGGNSLYGNTGHELSNLKSQVEARCLAYLELDIGRLLLVEACLLR